MSIVTQILTYGPGDMEVGSRSLRVERCTPLFVTIHELNIYIIIAIWSRVDFTQKNNTNGNVAGIVISTVNAA